MNVFVKNRGVCVLAQSDRLVFCLQSEMMAFLYSVSIVCKSTGFVS